WWGAGSSVSSGSGGNEWLDDTAGTNEPGGNVTGSDSGRGAGSLKPTHNGLVCSMDSSRSKSSPLGAKAGPRKSVLRGSREAGISVGASAGIELGVSGRADSAAPGVVKTSATGDEVSPAATPSPRC